MIDALDTRPSHSYQGQDLFVLEVLGGQLGGYFLDSGASNGRKGSNTWLLESQYGWQGICVEPNAETFRQLRANRDCICLDCCLYDRDGPVDFLEAAGVYGGIIEAYDPQHLSFTRRMLGSRWPEGAPAPTVRREARTLRSVLRGAGAPPTIDYWSLDTEGSELALLMSFPFDEYRVRVLTVEHNNGPVREQIRRFLEGRGYRRARDLGIDDGYVLADEPARVSAADPAASGQAWRSAVWRGRRGR
ncbi:MAG TPA: FkbM family methyltransferase [Burkholderiaceae bacterium]|nr:FkbM family methyltransferase [Burkholderiaceae bacterium]